MNDKKDEHARVHPFLPAIANKTDSNQVGWKASTTAAVFS